MSLTYNSALTTVALGAMTFLAVRPGERAAILGHGQLRSFLGRVAEPGRRILLTRRPRGRRSGGQAQADVAHAHHGHVVETGDFMTTEEGVAGASWTEWEVEAVVASYFQMLRMQELGQKPNKTEHKRRLMQLLPARNEASIEYKHRNISAVLNLYGAQTLSGYKPLANFQRLLIDVVGRALDRDLALDEAALRAVETPAEQPLVDDFYDFVVDVPKPPKLEIRERNRQWMRGTVIKRDYLERESRNRSLGHAGELLIMEYEARRLHAVGAGKLADRIEHVSDTRGDGAGFDILSFDDDGRERFIEVKTTSYVAETPFFISPNEVDFSGAHADQFHLYRLFAFRDKPQMFTMPGAIAANCLLEAVGFRATLLAKD
jgi:hypothetical protein